MPRRGRACRGMWRTSGALLHWLPPYLPSRWATPPRRCWARTSVPWFQCAPSDYLAIRPLMSCRSPAKRSGCRQVRLASVEGSALERTQAYGGVDPKPRDGTTVIGRRYRQGRACARVRLQQPECSLFLIGYWLWAVPRTTHYTTKFQTIERWQLIRVSLPTHPCCVPPF